MLPDSRQNSCCRINFLVMRLSVMVMVSPDSICLLKISVTAPGLSITLGKRIDETTGGSFSILIKQQPCYSYLSALAGDTLLMYHVGMSIMSILMASTPRFKSKNCEKCSSTGT